MTLPLLVRRSLRQHLLSTCITAAGIALACGLLMCVWMVKTQSHAAFTQANSGFDAVLGARGSKLQLVLNAIFHLEASPGNIPAADAEAILARLGARMEAVDVGGEVSKSVSRARATESARSCPTRAPCSSGGASASCSSIFTGRPKKRSTAANRKWLRTSCIWTVRTGSRSSPY